jgi:hypothetical protein
MQATTLALDYLLRAVGDPVGDLRHIGPNHPEFDRAQAIRAGAGVLAKSPDTYPAIARVLRSTDARPVSPETRAHLNAAEAWLEGNPALAAESYASILSRWPHDLLALRLAQSCYFFLGWHDRLCAVVDAVVPAWTNERHGWQFVLAMASFVHAEYGDAGYAETLGRKALALDPACPLGVHAVTHAIAESGRPGSGAQWMRDQRAHWAKESRMRTHNAWHLAMFDVENGNIGSAFGILDAWLLPASVESPIDACDATALLWRLAAEGVDVECRWQKVSNAFERTLTAGFWPFVDLHAALAHWAAGKQARRRHLVKAIDRCAAGGDFAALRARHITHPVLRAFGAWTDGRHDEAVQSFASVQPLLRYAGGSRIQLKIFESIERDAATRQLARQRDDTRRSPAREQTLPPTDLNLFETVLPNVREEQAAKSHDAPFPPQTAR